MTLDLTPALSFEEREMVFRRGNYSSAVEYEMTAEPARQELLPLPKGEGWGEGEGGGIGHGCAISFEYQSARVGVTLGRVLRSLSPHPVPLPWGEGNAFSVLESFPRVSLDPGRWNTRCLSNQHGFRHREEATY